MAQSRLTQVCSCWVLASLFVLGTLLENNTAHVWEYKVFEIHVCQSPHISPGVPPLGEAGDKCITLLVTSCWVACDGLASPQRGVVMLLVASCWVPCDGLASLSVVEEGGGAVILPTEARLRSGV